MRKSILLALASAAAFACRCGPRPSLAPPGPDAGADGAAREAAAPDAGNRPPALVEAEGEPPELPVRFRCASDGDELSLRLDGKGTLRRAGSEPAPLALPLVDAGDVVLAHCAFLPEGLLLVLGLADNRSAWGEIALLAGDPPVPRYVRYLPGLPSAAPLLEGSRLYLSASGFAGKFDVALGRFAWSHRGLEEVGDPEPPRREGEVVAFLDASGKGLRADDQTGLALPPPAVEGQRPATSTLPDRAEAKSLLAVARAALPGFTWLPGTFLKVDLTGDGEPDYAVAGAGEELVAVVVVRGSPEKGAKDVLLVHAARPEEASLSPERLRSPPTTLVCPLAEEAQAPGGRKRPAAERPSGPNRAECEAYLRRRELLEELSERNVQGLVLLPAGVHLLFDPEARRLSHWGPE